MQGKIQDIYSGSPVFMADIFYSDDKGNPLGPFAGETSNIDGKFNINPTFSQYITLQHELFKTKTIFIGNQQNNFVISMEPNQYHPSQPPVQPPATRKPIPGLLALGAGAIFIWWFYKNFVNR